jgi:hypothetical protein
MLLRAVLMFGVRVCSNWSKMLVVVVTMAAGVRVLKQQLLVGLVIEAGEALGRLRVSRLHLCSKVW